MQLNIDSCEAEPIHLCEAVQNRGLLLAVEPAVAQIRVYSENLHYWFNADIAIGRTSVYELIEIEPAALRRIYQELNGPTERRSIDVKLNRQALLTHWHDVSPGIVYLSGEWLVFELEPYRIEDKNSEFNEHLFNYQKLLPNLFAQQTLEGIATDISKYVRSFTGFDRVMVYKLDEDSNGSVIAEAKSAEVSESYLGLQFPAADIPAQARKLYALNWIRSVFDTDGEVARLLPSVDHLRKPLDLSLSVIRAVSPFHIQYLKNMGVRATMSIPLMKDERLWGLIACHHYTPKYLPQNRRLACEALGQLYSWQLVSKEQAISNRVVRRGRDEFMDILRSFHWHDDFERNMASQQKRLLKLMDACGVAVVMPNQVETFGATPAKSQIPILLGKLYQQSPYAAASSHKVHGLCAGEVELGEVCGALAVPLSAYHSSHVVWFRKARTKIAQRAARDAQLTSADAQSATERLTPRGSFELWQQVVQGESERWTEQDLSIAESFNNIIMSYLMEKKINNEKQLRKFEDLDRAKDQFLASISHELRSPLNAIVGWTDLALYDRNNTQKMIEALGVIKRSAHTQAELINDLLDLSRIVAGTLQLSVHTMHVEELLVEAVQSFETALTSKGIHFELACENAAETILGDKVRLKQVVSNLLSNAIKFTAKGGRIRLLGYRQSSNFFIVVEDTGKGLNRDDLAKVFDRFYQSSRAHGRQGLGLGLAITKQLVELHGGEIHAASPGLDLGATFTVCLPIAPAATAAGKRTLRAVANEKEQSQALAGVRILVVEDEEDSRMFLQHFLHSQGAIVATASDGRACLAVLRQSPDAFHLVLSDIGMPIMDGIELVKSVRQSAEGFRDVSCIALTAYAYATDRVKALKAGFDSYVSKPVDAEELLTVIGMQLNIKERQKS